MDCHRASSLNLNVSMDKAFWLLVPVRDYSNVKHMLAATGFTPLLLNLEILTSKPNAGEGSKNCIVWKVQKAAHYFVHADKFATNSTQPQEGCLIWDVEQPLYKLHRKFLDII